MLKTICKFKKEGVIKLLLFCLFCMLASPSFSQVTTKQPDINNLSTLKVDELSDDQVRQFLSQVQAMGLSESQLEQMALSRGMSSSEVQKLRSRIEKLQRTGTTTQAPKTSSQSTGRSYSGTGQLDTVPPTRQDSLSPAARASALLRSRIFGSSLFAKNSRITFEPNLRLATPKDYQIGPDDELLIDIYGYSEASYALKVSPEGKINVPYVGVIQVGGTTIEQATARIRSRLSTIYSGLRTGKTSLSISLGNIRSIKVILTGELVRPGTYSLTSLATVFNALYLSGGPTENGSFRQIEIIRAGKKVAVLDLYDFLLTGSLKNNLRLQDQDVIHIPTYVSRIGVAGEVKRPGLFELLPGESFDNLLRFAGGFNERAYRARVKVLKNTEIERKITDVTSSQFSTYQPSTGDEYFVEAILERFVNRVTISGAIFRPGLYELSPGLTLRQLIKNAEGLRDDAFQSRGYITRLKDDMQTELVSFDVASVLAGRAADIPLKREDVVTISSIFDLKELYNVRVDGEVQRPGSFAYAEGMTLEDAIVQAGGLKESATGQRVEVSRRVKSSNVLSASAQTSEVFQVNINQDLKSSTQGFVLQPYDIVVVRSASGYEVQRTVHVEGEVLYPGSYTIRRKDERISDLIQRAGGFTALAYTEGASLRRPGPSAASDTAAINKRKQEERLKQFQRLQNIVADTATTTIAEAVKRNNYVGISLPRILNKPGSEDDLFLEEGDILYVPKQLQTVKVNGEVLSPVTVQFNGNKGFKTYISNAGGFTQKALKHRSYVVYANGSVKATKKFLLFNNYPRIKSGAEIFVPAEQEKRKLSAGELIGITSGIASLGALIIGVLSSLKK